VAAIGPAQSHRRQGLSIMKLQFLNPTFHGILDYLAAGALITLPFLLGFQGIELWLSVAGGAGLILYSLITDYQFGLAKLVPYNMHLVFDVSAGLALLVAPFVLGFGFAPTIYYPVMAIGVFVVVAVSQRATSKPA
jgi:hypothetical protein